MDLLLQFKADVDTEDFQEWGALHIAVLNGYSSVVQKLVDNKVAIDTGPRMTTALHIAAWKNRKNCANIIIDAKADLNFQTNNGFTALHIACLTNAPDVVEILLARHAPINSKTGSGETPIHLATRIQDLRVMNLLISAKALINLPESRGWTPLHVAAETGVVPLVRHLLQAGGSVNAQQHDGAYPLQIAAHQGHAGAVGVLLQTSPKQNEVALAQALIAAAKNSHAGIVRSLLDAKAGVNHRTEKGTTALAASALAGAPKIVGMLLTEGANPNVISHAACII